MNNGQEKAIISEVLNGHYNQYRAIVDRYQIGLIQHLYNMVHDEQSAEDIAQDAFIRAYDKLYQYNQSYAFSTWLYKIADNMALRVMKRTKVTVDFDEVQDLLADKAPAHGESLDLSINGRVIRGMVDSLPSNYRRVIMLYYWDEFGYEDIAAIMERPVGTVRTWLHRAKDQLRKELDGKV